MVDMAHFAGLVAGKVLKGDYNPVPFAEVVTSTTHKTLRGPRGGLILCKKRFADIVDRGCPLVQGGPMPHIIAAKAVAFAEAQQAAFREYAHKIVFNAKNLAKACLKNGLEVITGGTDNHLVILDLSSTGLTGRQGESALRDVGIMVNRNTLPLDKNGPWYTSGLRIGTPALTTLGMGEVEMVEVAEFISKTLKATRPKNLSKGENNVGTSRSQYNLDHVVIKEILERVHGLAGKFPLYPNLNLSMLRGLLR